MSDPARRREVFDVVLALLAEVGYERFTMDLVAQRARASKATLYQRWPSKAELVVDALQEHQQVAAGPEAGSYPDDLRRLLAAWLAGWTERDRGLMLALLEGSRRDPEVARLRRERLSRPLRQAAEAALARARGRGEIPGQVDEELLVELPFALVLTHVLVLDEQPSPELVDRIVDGVLVPLLRGGPGAGRSPAVPAEGSARPSA
ncbi:TetR/AcrR family transcriptional regulator [Kitasatospora sp. GP82]|uniref:TetR/AcrR family transcriptional regulator n=1 Tax=Kitasatospora sp. GP82 TaxID=3035089 RepID=UPI0024739894|nr:TetR/AcrR family transcriptional regulator [Kitasatospora sp. GP82]